MNTEDFQDAMNFLDDDLIQETDDLRQGRRVLMTHPTVRQVLSWAVPAACLVLILGLAPRLLPNMETADNAGMKEMSQGSAENPVADDGAAEQNYGVESQFSETALTWKPVALGNISLSIPGDWEYETVEEEDGGYRILFRPKGTEGQIVVGYTPNFGVCGTGLETVETEIAGMQATLGIYDGKDGWDYITFQKEPHWYVALNEAMGFWWEDNRQTVVQILDTLVIEEG